MPTPEHLIGILNELGDGGTTEMAEMVHSFMERARADERGHAPAIETLRVQLDVVRNDLARIRDGADPSPVPENSWPTVGQLWHQLTTADLADREERLAHLLDAAQRQATGRIAGDATAETQPAYPHRSGDAITIGPEAFASDDGKVIAWRGTWYRLRNGETPNLPDVDYPPKDRATIDGFFAEMTGREAAASVALDRDPEAQTFALDDQVTASDAMTVEKGEAEDGACTRCSGRGCEACDARTLPAAELADTPDDDIDWNDDAGQTLQETVGDQLAATEGTPGPSNAEIRAWCLANDVPVNTKGAVRADARAAYDIAHQA